MPYEIAQHAGFCAGVRKAMDTAVAVAAQARDRGIPCTCLGELIHNPDAISRLEGLGVNRVDQVDEVPQGMVILRSHGVPPDVMAACQAKSLEIVDCTCQFVKALHSIVAQGLPVILVGDPEHPEVVGTKGWCQGACHIVQNVQEAAALPPMETALLVSQTTFPPEKWEEILAIIEPKVQHLQVHCTICPATSQRQNAARALAEKADCMVVVGGRHSANTRKLYELCLSLCPRTYLVERAAELPQHFADIHTEYIGITAGASTPDWSFKEVIARMNDMEHNVELEAVVQPAQEPALTEEEQRQKNFMDAVDKSLVRIRNGQTVTGTVVQLTEDEVSVNIGYKSDGIIKRSELVDENVKLGDEIEVEVVKVNDGEGNVVLSQRNIINKKTWDELMAKFESGEYIDAVGKEVVNKGLLAYVNGIRAFIPASQLAQRYVEKIDQFVGQPMKLKIIDVDVAKKRIVASRKKVIEEEGASKKAAAWEKLVEGAVLKGTVRRFADFGAFVDLGGVDGLIHITDMAWNRVGHPSEVLSVNQEIDVKVLSVDRERERIQLGLKQLQSRPWDNIEEKYPVGVILERNVVRIRPFGAFVELEPGVDGLVHISQCALTRVAKVEDALTVGQPVRVKVLAVDPAAKRISLSVREALADEAEYIEIEIPDAISDLPADESAE